MSLRAGGKRVEARGVWVVGHAFAPGAPLLTHVSTALRLRGKKKIPAALPGEDVWKHVSDDGAHCPSAACHAASNDHIGAVR